MAWDRSDQMPKRCFVIAPIGEENTQQRVRSDQILRHVISPVVSALGYAEPIRADKIGAPGIITSQVIQHIVDDEMVIADLTGENPNVYYELAIRHALRKPLVQMIEKGERIPFDVAAARTIIIDHSNLDSVEKAKAELSYHIRAAEEDPSAVENPISMALDLKVLRDSADPLQRSVATLTEELAAIREEVRAIRHDQNVLDKMKTWDAVLKRMDKFEDAVEKVRGGIYDLDDIMSELQDLGGRIDDLEEKFDKQDE